MGLRVVLLGASALGMVSAIALWAMGHGHLALRVLAADVLAILATLLLL